MRSTSTSDARNFKELLQDFKNARRTVTIDCGSHVDTEVSIVDVRDDFLLCKGNRMLAFPINAIRRVYWSEDV
jgi:hypothetical protein